MANGFLSGLKERTTRTKPDGRRYGATLLSVFAIVFLVLVLPWWLTLSAEIALRAANAPTETTTTQQNQQYGNNADGITWAGFTDGPTPTALSGILNECTPFNDYLAAPLDQYPADEMGGWYQYVDGGVQNYSDPANLSHYIGKTYVNIGTFLRADYGGAWNGALSSFEFCSPMNDEREWRFNGTHGPFKTGSGLAMTRFNMTSVAVNCASPTTSLCMTGIFASSQEVHNASWVLASNYSWRVEVNGEVMFSKDVREGDPESYSRSYCYNNCTAAGIAAGNAIYIPTLQFVHNLTVEETYRMRNALQAQTPQTLDVRLIWRCVVPVTLPLYVSWGDAVLCAPPISGGGGLPVNVMTQDTDHWIYAEVEYVEADDWATGIKFSMFISGSVMIFLALGSTPFYDPTLKLLGRFNS